MVSRMKALVLSGGAGTRLRPITRTSPEQLMPVADRPVLFHEPESLTDAGISDVGTAVGDTTAEIEDAVGDESKFCPQAACIPQVNSPGAAHAVLTAPAVRYPADPRADVRRTVVRGCRKDTGNAVDLLEAARRVRTLLASDAPRGTAPDALTCAGTLGDLEPGRPRPEPAHGDGRDAGLPATAPGAGPTRPTTSAAPNSPASGPRRRNCPVRARTSPAAKHSPRPQRAVPVKGTSRDVDQANGEVRVG